ncbi:hypothetical protein ABZV60_33985 [Streptomyces sp. NPDC004787]|uniref:hypothetical protein n=1 Tax=Streptomyces sp. NPDC004787 TaxID=3154291 RepID=UPI0033AE8380
MMSVLASKAEWGILQDLHPSIHHTSPPPSPSREQGVLNHDKRDALWKLGAPLRHAAHGATEKRFHAIATEAPG